MSVSTLATPYTIVVQTVEGHAELAPAQVLVGPALLRTPEAAVYLGLSAGTLAAWRAEGSGPRYVRLGKGSRAVIGYRREDLDDFITENTH